MTDLIGPLSAVLGKHGIQGQDRHILLALLVRTIRAVAACPSQARSAAILLAVAAPTNPVRGRCARIRRKGQMCSGFLFAGLGGEASNSDATGGVATLAGNRRGSRHDRIARRGGGRLVGHDGRNVGRSNGWVEDEVPPAPTVSDPPLGSAADAVTVIVLPETTVPPA